MLESSSFLLAFLFGLLFGGVLESMAEVWFGLETRNDPLFIAVGAVGGTVLALSAAATVMQPPM
jgi:hypothetical protein